MNNANAKLILDACCGSRMFWFDKNNPNVEFHDNREIEKFEYYPHRYIEIKPDTVGDFRNMPYPDKAFKLVVFDPPHLMWAGKKSWMALKYGKLEKDWPDLIHDGFWECMRDSASYRIAERFGVITAYHRKVVFYFERRKNQDE
jgi:hypothetical protein